jgi:hypothetical protein
VHILNTLEFNFKGHCGNSVFSVVDEMVDAVFFIEKRLYDVRCEISELIFLCTEHIWWVFHAVYFKLVLMGAVVPLLGLLIIWFLVTGG